MGAVGLGVVDDVGAGVVEAEGNDDGNEVEDRGDNEIAIKMERDNLGIDHGEGDDDGGAGAVGEGGAVDDEGEGGAVDDEGDETEDEYDWEGRRVVGPDVDGVLNAEDSR